MPKVQKERSASSTVLWVARQQAGGVHVGEVGMEVAEGCDGGAFTGEDVDVGEEGVKGAGVS